MRGWIVLSLVASLAGPALARSPNAELKSTEPNKMVCRTAEVLGSRLQTKKTCMTVVQWDQKEREERMVTERIQSLRTTNAQ